MKIMIAGMAATLLALAPVATQAQVPSYGQSINLETAKKVIAAGQAEARKNSWPVAIAIIDNAGNLVAYEKMDDTQTASIDVVRGRSPGAKHCLSRDYSSRTPAGAC